MTSLAQGAAGVALVVALALLGVRERGGAMVLLAVQAVAVAVSAAALDQFAAARGDHLIHRHCNFGDIGRTEVRLKSVEAAIDLLAQLL